MKNHTKIYMKYFNYKIAEDCFCEIPGCGLPAKDVNHIDARGMGGSKTADKIENLMGTCRMHHIEYGDKPQYRDWLIEVHKKFMERNKAA